MKSNLKRLLLIFTLIFSAQLCACSQNSEITQITKETAATPIPLITIEKPDSTTEVLSKETEWTQTYDIMITEISAADKDWVEFFNSGKNDILLSEYSIGTSSDYSKAVSLPDLLLRPGEYCCVFGKQETEKVKADFSINKAGDTLFLFQNNGVVVSSVVTPALTKNTSIVCNGETWSYTYFKTPGLENSSFVFNEPETEEYSENCPIEISEVLASNKHAIRDGYGSYSDFAEIHNISDRTICLSGWFLSDSKEDPAKWAFPDVYLDPDAYLAVFLSGMESIEGELHASFSLNEEEELILLNGKENKCISFTLPDHLIHDISVSSEGIYYRYPTPGLVNAYTIDERFDIGYYFEDDIYISEACAFGDDNDWVELYNGSSTNIDLTNWHLTDDLSVPDKFTFDSFSLLSGSYCVISASSHIVKQTSDTAPFGLSLSGECLYLIDAENRVRDVFETGMLDGAASSGRIEGRTDIDRVFFAVSTPGTVNSSSYFSGRTAEPLFSHIELYCNKKFELSLSSADGAEIYFTTDGSEPKESSKQLYASPITISKNTVVRAFAIKDGCLKSNVVTYTYLFEKPHDIPVVCIAMSPSDKNDVWSAKSKQSKSKVEREGYLSYYEDGKLGVSFPAGFKPKGAGTLGRSQASLSIHLRGLYGQSKVTYPFFSEYGWETYASLVVRNSGQDYLKGRIRDSLASRICLGLNIDVSATRPVAVYVNGAYYGLYDLNEDQNADFLHTHYGVEQSKVEIIRFNTVTVKGSNTNWKKVIDYAKTKNFKHDDVYDEFLQWVDADYFIDYLVCSIYLCNSDMANQKYWHTVDNEIKWRPIFYDFDYAMGFNRSAKSSILERFFDRDGTATATSRVYTHIACALVDNPDWREKFIERYIELTYTTFDPQRVSNILDQLVSEMESEMPRHIEKWGKRNAPASMKEWRENIESLRDWFNQRQKYAIESLKKYFKLSDSEIKEISSRYI